MQRLVVPQSAVASYDSGVRGTELVNPRQLTTGNDRADGVGIHTFAPVFPFEPARRVEGGSTLAEPARTPAPVTDPPDNQGTTTSSVEIRRESPPEPRESYRPPEYAVPKTVIDVRPVGPGSPVNPLLVALADAYSPTADAYRSVRRKLATNEDPRVIAVTSASPGEGKTVLTLNLALTVRASTRGRVLVVEANLRSPIVAEMLGFEPPECFIDQIRRHVDGPQLPWIVAEPFPRLHVLAVDTRVSHEPILDSVGFATAMNQIKNAGYDFILVDTPPVLGSGDVNVIADAVEGILLAAVPLKSKRGEMRRAAMQLAPAPILGAVLLDI
jgi:Mrp family chromosome partitioning ATPase